MWAIIAILILGLGAVGYGFYDGYKTKNFAAQSEKIFNESQGKWKVSELTNPPVEVQGDSAKLKDYYTKIKDDCDSATSKIESLAGTRKTKTAKTDLDRYYSLGKQASENALILVDYMAAMEKISKNMSPTINASGFGQLTTQLNQFKATVDDNLKTLQALKTTPSIEETNKQIILAMTELSNFLDQVLTQLKNNNPKEVERLMNEFSTKMEKTTNIKTPDPEEIKKDILTKSEEEEMTGLALKIQEGIKDLKKVIFAF